MKAEGQIHQKVKQLCFRHQKRELERLLEKTSYNCKNNTKVDTQRAPLGVCRLDCKTCDPAVDDRAPGCPSFLPLHEKEQIKESLKTFFETRSPQEISIRFPDVAALLWALDSSSGALFPGALSTSFLGVDLWVDSPDDRATLKLVWDLEQEKLRSLSEVSKSLADENEKVRKENDRLLQEQKELNEQSEAQVELSRQAHLSALAELTLLKSSLGESSRGWRRWFKWLC